MEMAPEWRLLNWLFKESKSRAPKGGGRKKQADQKRPDYQTPADPAGDLFAPLMPLYTPFIFLDYKIIGLCIKNTTASGKSNIYVWNDNLGYIAKERSSRLRFQPPYYFYNLKDLIQAHIQSPRNVLKSPALDIFKVAGDDQIGQRIPEPYMFDLNQQTFP